MDPPDDLDAMLAAAWALLRRGVADRRHGFHTPTLCTVGVRGRPAARTVVLRGADEAARTILCHADARSAKIAHVRAAGEAAWHFYDRAAKAQLVLATAAAVHADDVLADERWAATGRSGRATYARPHPPGTAVAAPWQDDAAANADAGRANFAVVRGVVQSLDVLLLHHAGHQRALFTFDDSRAAATWLTP